MIVAGGEARSEDAPHPIPDPMTPRNSLPALILALLFSASACTDRPGTEQEVETAVPHASTKECKPSIHPFWAKFREAVLKEDWEAVAGMTEFPLVVERPSPAARKHISRQEFTKHFPQFLNAPHGGKYPRPDMTMRELIRDTPTLDKRACGDFEDYLNIGRWYFYARTNGWHFGSIDTPEFPPSMKDIPFQPPPRIKD